MFDFDIAIDRKDWDSVKWAKYSDRDVLPFWVADMDFATPNFILEAISARLQHPILGYTSPPNELFEVFTAWAARNFGWLIDPEWVVPVTAVVPGLHLAVRSIGTIGDGCLIPYPIYPPILEVPEQNNRRALHSRLERHNTSWVMDLGDIAKKARESSTLVLCNPQNPTGRVYSHDELLELATLCLELDTTIISDEIHWGLILDDDCSHVPIASLSQDIADNTITLLSHTKSYNVAGLLTAMAIVPNASLRERMRVLVERTMPSGSPLAYAAAVAAYADTSSWLQELNSYLRTNRDQVKQTIDDLPDVGMADIEGTHLAWIDVRSLPVQNAVAYFEAFGLGLSDGAEFGSPGFVRLNFAAPHKLLYQGLQRFRKAIACAA